MLRYRTPTGAIQPRHLQPVASVQTRLPDLRSSESTLRQCILGDTRGRDTSPRHTTAPGFTTCAAAEKASATSCLCPPAFHNFVFPRWVRMPVFCWKRFSSAWQMTQTLCGEQITYMSSRNANRTFSRRATGTGMTPRDALVSFLKGLPLFLGAMFASSCATNLQARWGLRDGCPESHDPMALWDQSASCLRQ